MKRKKSTNLTICAVVLCAALPLAASGFLDLSFSGDGVGDYLFSAGTFHAMAVQADDKIVAVGEDNDRWAIARIHTDGSLDAGFGSGGVVSLFASNTAVSALDVEIDASQRIVVTGWDAPDGALFTVVRLLSDGSLDPSFGSGGVVQTAITNEESVSRALAIQPDGKIVVAGYVIIARGTQAIALARYNEDGSLDDTFGDSAGGGGGRGKKGGGGGSARKGYTIDDLAAKKHEGVVDGVIALQTDGKILVGGFAGSKTRSAFHGFNGQNEWVVSRYHPDGSVDTTFAADGHLFSDITFNIIHLAGLAVQADGKIVASGRGQIGSGNYDILVTRYHPDGSTDTSFGTGGIVVSGIPASDLGGRVVLQSDGKIVVGGHVDTGSGDSDYIAFRWNSDGSPDATFGVGGLSETGGAPGFSDFARGVALDQDQNGDIFVCGGASTWAATVAKYSK